LTEEKKIRGTTCLMKGHQAGAGKDKKLKERKKEPKDR